MFTSYRLPVMPELTVGGGVNWQNRVYTDTVTPYGTFRAEQGSYALVDLFTRYQVTKNFSLQGNVNNLFDKPTIPTWKVLSSTAHRVISALPARINSE
ncbi:ferric-rhodotorulic acid outer membrane transporter [Escherichia coli]|uniref:Ferric-rhodotorulic acid outer membrane transporter n=1 Tax=Escherichia coli TaxID=562 RepID=A0A376W2M8_ECOLX|nr:ferric-rhodotorulic acid outer membrane transporter [Escherichia coli]